MGGLFLFPKAKNLHSFYRLQTICASISISFGKNKKLQVQKNLSMYRRSSAPSGARLTSQQVLSGQRMGYRTISPRKNTPKSTHHRGRYITAILLLAILLPVLLQTRHSVAAIPELKSGVSGYCMDDFQSKTASDTPVDNWTCNGTDAQEWTASQGNITHDSTYCLSVSGDSKSQGAKLVMNTCSSTPGQVWLAEQSGYMNPNSDLCLSAPAKNAQDQQLTLTSCSNLGKPGETWNSAASKPGVVLPGNSCKGDVGGQKIACVAEEQWSAWQNNPENRPNLLSNYTDGNAYEEWCADFVSYVYMTAGQPFANGERNGWDEYDANSVQNQGFTKHWANDYTPKTGDIAYFDYNGGHVEIVASGGENPTFIYGDSGTPDPVTGNGNMAANTLTGDGDLGQVIYYLSPNI